MHKKNLLKFFILTFLTVDSKRIFLYILKTRRLTQAVRERSAKPLCSGSIPLDAFQEDAFGHPFFIRPVLAKPGSVYIDMAFLFWETPFAFKNILP